MAKKESSYNPDLSGEKQRIDYKKAEAAKKKAQDRKLTKPQRFANFFRNGRTRFAIGVICLLTAVYLLLAFISFLTGAGDADQSRNIYHTVQQNAQPGLVHNWVGSLGTAVSEFLVRDGFGVAAFVLVLWLGTIAVRFLKRDRKVYFFSYTLLCLYSLFAFSLIIAEVAMFTGDPLHFPLGGNFGQFANENLKGWMGLYGMIAVNFVIGLVWVLLTWNRLSAIAKAVSHKMPHRPTPIEDGQTAGEENDKHGFLGDGSTGEKQADNTTKTRGEKSASTPAEPLPAPAASGNVPYGSPVKTGRGKQDARSIETTFTQTKAIEQGKQGREFGTNDPTLEYAHYHFPPLELLNDTEMRSDGIDVQEEEENKKRITETLNNYGIQIKKIEVHVGPTITLFEIVPEDGIRISKIRGLEDDIALSLAALGIRIIAPMPGRGTIGIEVPNRDPQIVPIRQVLGSKKFQNTDAKLPMALGCTVSNEIFIADLTKMPHLLVAGATGKGKSVGLNTIIASLLYKKGPSELKIILIDPKRVEFSIYADLEKYYFAKAPGEDRSIVTETSKVVKTLNCLVQEMENRYKVLEDVKVRKVEDYNKKWRNELRNAVDERTGEKKYKYMPYIVCIIDEFSDMIMTAGKEVETPIVRIAQKARAVGIHMIIATQRPSSQVITGLIKGNFPGRMAFAVSQMIDSRIILDRSGAQHLIGRGDMLFSVDGVITRLQCPFIDTPEIVRICDYIKEQEDADTNIYHEEPYTLPEYVAPSDNGDSAASNGGGAAIDSDRDPYFEEVAKWIVASGDTASTSSIQRRWQIGYNRAGRIMDQMEKAGIVGPSVGGKPRKVLLSPMDIDQMFSAPSRTSDTY